MTGDRETKSTESYEQLIERFNKRTTQLEIRKEQLHPMYSEYVQIERDLERLRGSLQVAEYLAYGTLPGDGNHDGMRHHKPRR
jgi:hypothetical protein